MHNLLCRLCLQVTTKDQWKLYEKCSVSEKIRTLLDLEIVTNNVLPQRLCNKCCNKIDEFDTFCHTVQENQQILIQHLEKGSLKDYYLSKTEIKEDILKNDIKITDLIAHENKNINEVLHPTEFVIGNTELQNNLIKNEEVINNYDFYSSDDNLTLSILKGEKTHNLTEKSQYLIEKYNCLSCNSIYNTNIELRQHYKKEHSKENVATIENSFTEQICNGKVKFRCDKCNKIYSKRNMKRHIMYHSNERPYVCKLCARTYKTISDIMRHGFRAHSGHRLHCSYKCGFSTAYTGALKEHEDRIHKNVYKYKCKECGKGFQVKTWYEQHQNIHTGLKPFVCDICGLSFHMDKYLKTHNSTVHPECSYKKRLVCLHCDQKWDSVNGLAVHLQKEHNIEKFNTKCKRTCLCDLCGKVLNRPEQLLTHRKMHNGEKPYHCRICNKSFLRKYSVRVHERAHDRTRDYLCEPCGTRYSQPSALYRHQRIHHGLPRKRTQGQKI